MRRMIIGLRFCRSLISMRIPSRTIGYTLVEMLAVLGVLGVMSVALLPALQGVNKSSSRKVAVATVMAGLDQARTLAIAQGRSSYVVFATDLTMQDDYRYKAFAVFQDDEALNAKMVSKWILLPAGICFKKVASLVTALPAPFNCAGTSRTLPYVKFGPTGMIQAPTDPSLLQLVLWVGNTGSNGTQFSTDQGQVTAPIEKVSISPSTGRAKYQGD
jgi:type II secretory pathway pseudopilin PulG